MLQDSSYRYDRAGTLLKIEDRVHPDGPLSGIRGYGYDDLYRLKIASSPSASWSFDYDEVGNLLHKSDVGAYAYGGAQPDAVQSIGGRPVTWDANGSMTSSFGRTFEYDALGQLRKVLAPEGSVTEYVYDNEGQRTVKRVRTAEATKTVVYLDRFAGVRDGEIVDYVFAGDVRIARLGAPRRL